MTTPYPDIHLRPRRVFAVFDSNLGGLPTLLSLHGVLKDNHLFYIADDAFFPYGRMREAEIAERLRVLLRQCVARGICEVALACNTASVIYARCKLAEEFPEITVHSIVETGAALAADTDAATVGVFATDATVAAQAYPLAIRELAGARVVRIFQQSLQGTIDRLGAGQTDGPEIRAELDGAFRLMLHHGATHILLGCTHFSLCRQALMETLPVGMSLLDPAEAFVNRLASAWSLARGTATSGPGDWVTAITTGDVRDFQRRAAQVLNFRPVTEPLAA